MVNKQLITKTFGIISRGSRKEFENAQTLANLVTIESLAKNLKTDDIQKVPDGLSQAFIDSSPICALKTLWELKNENTFKLNDQSILAKEFYSIFITIWWGVCRRTELCRDVVTNDGIEIFAKELMSKALLEEDTTGSTNEYIVGYMEMMNKILSREELLSTVRSSLKEMDFVNITQKYLNSGYTSIICLFPHPSRYFRTGINGSLGF